MNEELLKIDICSRLPYGVKAVTRLCPIPSIVKGMYPGGKYFLGDDRKVVRYPIRPILFPISCLTEEIQFRGGKISPLVEIGKMEGLSGEPVINFRCGHFYAALYENDIEICYDAIERSFIIERIDGSESFPCNAVKALDWLNSHMIDYRGLIDKGLAKSVFDLKKNPYE